MPGSAADHELGVLLLAPTGRDTPLIYDLLTEQSISCTAVMTLDALLETMGTSYPLGVAVIAEEAIDPAHVANLAAGFDAEPPWSDLPVLLLARPQAPSSTLQGALNRRSTHVLHRPLKPATLLSAIRSAIEIRRRQYEVRDLLHDARNLNEQLQWRMAQLRRLSLQIGDAEEQERRRLAVYVHDDLQQILAGIKFHLDVTRLQIDDPQELDAGLERIGNLVRDAIAGTRSLAHELSPAALHRNGLPAALNWLAEHVHTLHGLRVDVSNAVGELHLEGPVAIFLFRAAQELLLNVSKHALTDYAEVRLRREGAGIRLEVADRGRGFDATEFDDVDAPPSFGLFSIRERAELLGGTTRIDSVAGEGTTVTLFMPSEEPMQDAESPEAPEDTGLADAAHSVVADDLRSGDSRIRVVLVDDHVVVRSGLRLALTQEPRIEVIDECDDGFQAVQAAERVPPDIIVMDVEMPGMDGIEATRRIKRRHPEIRIIGLSMFDDPETSRKMRQAGADSYLSKAGPSEELIAEILARAESGAR
jgi:signal transduction histidine kinase/CheY-like chemotaxis protein